ncbi:T9SS type A sorting domain-containing protein [Chryseobacterium sp. 8AT]|uniref:T9SS type A sorting domain-containing protein n=1 Tax=Chryseobacterium sp. 8AT TaxID=2653134 RepID=UPI0012F39DF8|nr:T9SS type A sorting domain-containing protein [Chryseobacterium sp. 8AT]VXC32555.1 Por secretion system C-terminal sorting domain-containing protein [Chryseobacterium sp. 8AT]
MRKQSFTLLLAVASSLLAAQQTTLQHFDPTVTTPVIQDYGSGVGYYTGHNSYGDEEFAEKYEISGSAQLVGVSAIHLGQDGTATLNANYKAYTVAANGLPGSQLVSKTVAYSQIPVNGTLTSQLFSTPVNVTGSFFVSFNLGDYSHGGLGTKRIAVSHSPHGSRPSSDLGIYGRNAIRFHSHGGAPDWVDYQTENFSNYSPDLYFSLFPIVELNALSTVEFNKKGSIGAVYPNPSSGNFRVPVQSDSGGDIELKLFDMSGKLISEKKERLSFGKNEVSFSDQNLHKGVYLLLIKTPEGSISQRVVIH